MEKLKVALVGVYKYIQKYFHILIKYCKNIYSKICKVFNVILCILPKKEKLFLLILLFVIFFGSIYLIYNKYIHSTEIVPDYGGEYKEGIIADSISDATSVTNKLTKIGLVSLDKDGQIRPELASSWNISDDKKEYTFEIIDGVNAQELVDTIKKEKPSWSDIDISSPEEHVVKFNLKQPFAPLLANLCEPIFPYGPYKISKQNKTDIQFIPNEKFIHAKPYIEKISIYIYPDYNNLLKALKSKQLDGGSYILEAEDLPKNFTYYEIKLPRYLMLFFNLNNQMWQNKELRNKLANSENIGQELNATLVTSTKEANTIKAQEIKESWQSLGVNIDTRFYDAKKLQSEIIPQRQYDLLLYGLDYGYDPDLYPFWHSSQISDKGLNLSNFSDVDADKLLEQGRMTLDQEERDKKISEFNNLFNNQKPAIEIKQEVFAYGISNNIKGVTTDFKAVIPADRFSGIQNWYIKEKRVKK